jgi:anti-sigma factor RsiW
MTMASPIDDDTLQRFYDGDLSPQEARSLEAQIAGDPTAQRRLRELGRLSVLLREAADELSSTLDSDALFARIEASITAPAKAPPRTSVARTLTERPSAQRAAMTWLTRRRATLVPAFAATAVAAAALFAVLMSSEEPELGGIPFGEVAAPAQPSAAPADEPVVLGVQNHALEQRAPADDALRAYGSADSTLDELTDVALVGTAPGPRIDNVDIGSNTGTAFRIDSDDGAAGVLWIYDDEEAP